jgi:hypothetical protein
MSNLNSVISNFAAGSSLTLRRTIARVPDGSLIQTAVFTVKPAEPGADNHDIILKTIRTNDQSGVGQVENEGTDGTCQLRFELSSTDTMLLTPNKPYYYWIEVFLDRGPSTTVEKGRIAATMASPEQQKGNGTWEAARDARRAIEERARELMNLSAGARDAGDTEAMNNAGAELTELRQQYKRHSVAERVACIAHTCALNESLPAQLEAAQLAQWKLEAEYDALLQSQELERKELAARVDHAKAEVFDIETRLAGNTRAFSEAEAGFHAAIQRVLSNGSFA